MSENFQNMRGVSFIQILTGFGRSVFVTVEEVMSIDESDFVSFY